MRQKEMCKPPRDRISIQPVENWIEYRIKEKRKGAYHYHDFECHDKEYDYTSSCYDFL